MATTENFYTGNGSTTSYGFSFPILQNSDLKVALDGVTKTENTSGTNNDYSISNTNVVFNSAPANGVDIHIYRLTDVDTPKATFVSGSSIRAQDLNNNFDQLFYSDQEQHQRVRTVDVRDKAITSAKILDGTIVNVDINASAAIDGTKISPNFGSQVVQTTGNIVVGGTVDGRDVAADGTKLDGIESGATGDQTAAEIRTLIGNATNSNVFTDAESTKLSGIETGATADQTGAEIKTAYEAESNTNAYTDAEKTKLSGIATGAEVNVNADWNSSSGDSQILNKPTLVTGLNGLSDVNTSGVADGKILKYQASSSSFIIADDGGSGSGGATAFTGLSDTPANYTGAAGKTVKVNSAGNALEFVTVSGAGGLSDIVDDTSPQLGGNLDVQASEITTSTTNGNIKVTPNGTGLFEIKGNTNAGTLQLNCENNSHGVKIKSPPHSAAASYTLTLPNDDGSANQVLKTDGSGNLSWVNQTTQLSNAEVRTAVEAASDSNVFTDADHTKLNGITAGANVGITDLVSDTTPQLGGNLDTNGKNIEFKNSANNATKILFDAAQDQLEVADGAGITFGDQPDVALSYSNGNDFSISGQNGGSGDIVTGFKNVSGTILKAIRAIRSSQAVELFFGDAKKLETVTGGVTVTGTLTATDYAGDGSNLTGVASTKAGGAIYQNSQTISASHTIPTGSNGMSAGPVTVNNGITLTISNGSTYTIV